LKTLLISTKSKKDHEPFFSGKEGTSRIELMRKVWQNAGKNIMKRPHRSYVLTGRKRHAHARPDDLGYPSRAIRTKDFYIL